MREFGDWIGFYNILATRKISKKNQERSRQRSIQYRKSREEQEKKEEEKKKIV